MRKCKFLILRVSAFLFITNYCFSQIHILDSTRHHLRSGEIREWSEFQVHVQEKKLIIHFSSQMNPFEQTLLLRQYDVKLNWRITLNDHLLGSLISDEKDMITYFKISAGILEAKNTLEIKCTDPVSDDIQLGPIVLDNRPLRVVLSEAHIDIEVFDGETNKLIPARITITNAEGILQTVSASSGEPLAVRPGYVYTGSGKASLSLPAGTYTIYAGRGFEYGIDSTQLVIKSGDHFHKKFLIKREVSTEGWISSDTHVHTFTYSRHGDATASERVLTIAGEGLELPIITDHNIYVDLKPFALDNNVDRYFTPVIGNEITTKVGHFNLFPATTGKPVTDHRAENWKTISENIQDTSDVKAIILNHARDIHIGFRPFDGEKYLSSAGMRLDDWEIPANAMEVINSGSQQTDIMQLYHDWFGMLNRGYFLTPAGSSDSHDVSRYIVGQARTYIRGNDKYPGKIDVNEAVKNFRQGKVMVSLGLLTEITVNNAYGPGELVPASDQINVAVKVSGPGWTQAERVMLYANGKKIREEKIEKGNVAGIKWSDTWQLALPGNDIFLVAIAEGPGHGMPYWPIAKPYQPASPDWKPRLMGSTGAVWIDADKNGSRTSAYAYAKDLLDSMQGDIRKLIKNLAPYDEAVAIQAAALLHKRGWNLTGPDIGKALRRAAPETKSGFEIVIKELQHSRK